MAVDAPVTPTARQAKFREKRKAEGYKFVQVWLPAEIADKLQEVQRVAQLSQTEAITAAIDNMYEWLPLD